MKGRQVATGVAGFTPVGEAGECSIKCEDLQMSGESSALTERRGSFRKPFTSFFITKSTFSFSISLFFHRAIDGEPVLLCPEQEQDK